MSQRRSAAYTVRAARRRYTIRAKPRALLDTCPLKTTLQSELPRATSPGATSKAVSKSAPRKSSKSDSAAPTSAKPAAKKPAGSKKPVARGAAGKTTGSKRSGEKGVVDKRRGAKAVTGKGIGKPKAAMGSKSKPVKPAARSSAPAAKAPEKLAPEVAALRRSVLSALEEMKAKEVKEIDIRGKASFADLLVIASGTSTRHVKSLADEVVRFVKKAGMMPLGIEGEKEAEWVLVDLGDIVCHLMLPRIREFYALERLWSVGGDQEASND